jgi:anti-sigma B factor antagonist
VNPVIAAHRGLDLSARTEDRITIAELAGELDIASASDLREQLLGLLRPGSSRLVIDMSKVSFCDASGLAVLVGTGRRARALGGFLRLAAVSPQADRILRITGLHRHLPIFPTVSAATSPPGTPPSEAGTAAVSAHPARSWSGPASKPAGQARVMGELQGTP